MRLGAVSAYWAFDLYVFEQTDALFISECAEGLVCFVLLKIEKNNTRLFANTTISVVYRYMLIIYIYILSHLFWPEAEFFL